MNDPIESVINQIKQCAKVRVARQKNWLKPNFLNGVGDVFENHGFETTHIYLLNKASQHDMKGQTEALLDVLKIMRGCSAIHQRRAIGRQIIKTLNVIPMSH